MTGATLLQSFLFGVSSCSKQSLYYFLTLLYITKTATEQNANFFLFESVTRELKMVAVCVGQDKQ